jgi:hypothetical protein
MQISAIGLDLANERFSGHGIDATARLWFVSRFGGRRCCHFSPSCPLAWSV